MTAQATHAAPVTPRWRFNNSPLDLCVPVEGKEACPTQVWEASEAVRDAYRAHTLAKQQHEASTAALRQAESIDDSADRTALIAHSKLASPTKATPGAVQALALSDRLLKAASAELDDSQNALATAILHHHDEWSANVEAGRDEIKSDILSELDRIASLFAKLGTSDRIVVGLERFPAYPHGGTVMTQFALPERFKRLEEAQRGEELAKLQHGIREGHNTNMVSRNVNALLAALTTLAVPVKRAQSARVSL